MVLLDTNVISELVKPGPDARVVNYLRRLPAGSSWISSITIAEIKLGIELRPDGKNKSRYAELALATLQQFAQSYVPFDALAAGEFATIVAGRRSIGRPIGYADAQIAAIARATGFTLATRNTKDFEGIEGLKIVDPWGV